jgi:membrane protein DedA with SNARE-associated domain
MTEQADPQQKRGGFEFDVRYLLWGLVFGAIFIIGRFTPFRPVQQFFDVFSWLTEQALKITKDLFESYGYLTVFLAPLLENTIFLGALIPGTLVMMLGGLSAHGGIISLFPAIPIAIVGAWIGDTISYGIGRFGWQRLGAESRLVKVAEEMREPLMRQSAWLIIFYHFAGYSRMIGPAASGFLRVPFPRWVLLDYIGSALWVCVFMTAGYMLGVFGLSLDATDSNVRAIELVLFGLAAVGVTVIVIRTRRQRRDKVEEDQATAAAVAEDAQHQ